MLTTAFGSWHRLCRSKGQEATPMALSTEEERKSRPRPGQDADRAAVQRVIAKMSQAVRDKDVEAMLAVCTTDFITFDLVAPIQHQGAAAVRRLWAETLQAFDG